MKFAFMSFMLSFVIGKCVYRSFVPPVRDEESETQRKAHAKRVRETRRSTQGVTLDEIKSAEQLVKKKTGNGTTETQTPASVKKTDDNSIINTDAPSVSIYNYHFHRLKYIIFGY